MAALTRWDPFGDLVTLREAMDRLMNEAFGRTGRLLGGDAGPVEMYMPVDIWETKDDVQIRAVLPGVRPEEIEINVTGDTVTLKGGAKFEAESEGTNHHRREIRHGVYMRSFALPASVRSDQAEAVFENGVLTLRLPRAEEVKPKQIKVQTRGAIDAPRQAA